MRALFALMLLASPAFASDKVAKCMSLLNPDVLFCADEDEKMVVCDVSGAKARCQTLSAMYASWRKYPELRDAFYRKLYGAQ